MCGNLGGCGCEDWSRYLRGNPARAIIWEDVDVKTGQETCGDAEGCPEKRCEVLWWMAVF